MNNVTQRLFVYTAEGKDMRSHMGYRAKRELLVQIAPRYREASSALKEPLPMQWPKAKIWRQVTPSRPSKRRPSRMVRPTTPPPRATKKLNRAWAGADHHPALLFGVTTCFRVNPTLRNGMASQGAVSMHDRGRTVLKSPVWMHLLPFKE